MIRLKVGEGPQEPRYIQRDATGKVVAHFFNQQTYATELVPGDHPDLMAFKLAREAARERK